jgi:hypothetical protein
MAGTWISATFSAGCCPTRQSEGASINLIGYGDPMTKADIIIHNWDEDTVHAFCHTVAEMLVESDRIMEISLHLEGPQIEMMICGQEIPSAEKYITEFCAKIRDKIGLEDLYPMESGEVVSPLDGNKRFKAYYKGRVMRSFG